MHSLSCILGDNKSAVDSSVTNDGKIHQFYIALSFYQVRESVAAGIVNYLFADGKHNPEDTLSKHWVHNDIWPTLKPIFFWPEDNMECFDSDILEQCGCSFCWSLFLFVLSFYLWGFACFVHAMFYVCMYSRLFIWIIYLLLFLVNVECYKLRSVNQLSQ